MRKSYINVEKQGFQYADWQFDGADIVALVRTAYNDDSGGARNNHDANYITFHRIKNFRNTTDKNSARFHNNALNWD